MRVLWLCNCPLSDVDAAGTGTWLAPMARGLLESGSVELGVIAFGPVNQFTRRDYLQVKQWIVPGGLPLGRDGLPPASVVKAILAAAKEFAPDVVHVWGTEYFWGLLTARGLLEWPAVLLIQGLKTQIAKVFFGDLTAAEQIRCIGIKELLTRRSPMHSGRRDFARWRAFEEEIIRGHQFVDAQSAWGASQVRAINPKARLFSVDLPLRQPFYDAAPWQPPSRPTVFSTAASPSPLKGLHVAVRALALLRRRVPDARLRIAGAHQQAGLRQGGYLRWINRMVQSLDLAGAVDWLGPLKAEQIVAELQYAAAVVIPTFIETYCVALAEALSVGTPVVVSYAGGTPSLGKDDVSCLYFPPGDEAMCAYQLERVLTDEKLARQLSLEAHRIAKVRNDRHRIVEHQLSIYRQIVGTQ